LPRDNIAPLHAEVTSERKKGCQMPAPKKPDNRQFKVGDRVTVSLSAGRVVDGVVKAVIDQ
jgi:hypothetical protein